MFKCSISTNEFINKEYENKMLIELFYLNKTLFSIREFLNKNDHHIKDD
jgi:hypothetical protein